jgi:hypothetical protein
MVPSHVFSMIVLSTNNNFQLMIALAFGHAITKKCCFSFIFFPHDLITTWAFVLGLAFASQQPKLHLEQPMISTIFFAHCCLENTKAKDILKATLVCLTPSHTPHATFARSSYG